jgi:hypothetical protein
VRGAQASLALVVGVAAASAPVALGCTSHSSGHEAEATPDASRDDLLDPSACGNCHKQHYQDWSGSMHAQASDDPVFVAMNQRGQRETDGGLGSFCVNRHAPMAVRDGKTRDGLNLGSLDKKYKGVTCFFCHSIDSVDPAHPYNANVNLATNLTMRGEILDPAANTAHKSAYSSLHDRDNLKSGAMCGTCHDIQTLQMAHIERTYGEWRDSPYNAPETDGGSTCAQCHMPGGGFQPLVPGGRERAYYSHDFPAVDVALNPGPNAKRAQIAVQSALNGASVRGALCVTPNGGIRVVLDPFGIGHNWPSGAAQDRRVWAEVIAYKGGQIIYQSGVVLDGTPVGSEPEQFPEDLWVLRDQMFDSQCNKVDMFWQAAYASGNELPAAKTFDKSSPEFYGNHIPRFFPKDGTPLVDVQGVKQIPDRVTLRIRVQPIGLDVLNDLVDSGDLDAGVIAAVPTFDVSLVGPSGPAMLEWTAEAVADAGAAAPMPFVDQKDSVGAATTCVGSTYFIPYPWSATPPSPNCPP